MLSVVAITFILLLVVQLSLGLNAWYIKSSLHKKYYYPLGSQVDPATLLSKILSKNISTVQIKVVGFLDLPAYSENKHLLIKKSSMYKKDLFSNYYILQQFKAASDNSILFRNIPKYQNIIFTVEITLLVITLSLTIDERIYFAIATVVIQFILLMLGFFYFHLYGIHLNKHHYEIAELLELDELEDIRAHLLRRDLRWVMYEYPVEMIWKVWQFIKP